MTERVFYDTWAWKETALDTKAGRLLLKRYGPGGPATIHTSILALAEFGSKAARDPIIGAEKAKEEVRRMEQLLGNRIHGVEMDDVYAAIDLHPILREASDDASLADAIMLCQARRIHGGLPFISGDKAFRGQKDVRAD